jgi:hypothetical protein
VPVQATVATGYYGVSISCAFMAFMAEDPIALAILQLEIIRDIFISSASPLRHVSNRESKWYYSDLL